MNNFKKWGIETDGKLIIAGPCSAESENQVFETAAQIAGKGVHLFRAGIWKPRTRPGSFEGVGKIGLTWLKKVKDAFNLPVAVETASPEHIEVCLKHEIDVIWIGARTTASPFAVQAMADALKGVNINVLVKNPINPDLSLWIGAIERLKKAGIKNIGAIHRGFSSTYKSEYRYNPYWKIPIEFRRTVPELPIICDPSHICGNRSMILSVSQKAFDLLFDGLMIEVHVNPEVALSDAKQQLLPERLVEILGKLKYKKPSIKKIETKLSNLREQIDEIDYQLITMLGSRMEISKQIGKLKSKEGIAPFQPGRWNKVLQDRIKYAKKYNLSDEFIKGIFENIHEESIASQSNPR